MSEETLRACSICIKANEAKIAAGAAGPHKVPVLVVGGPEAQSCEHLATWVRDNQAPWYPGADILFIPQETP